MDVPELHEGRRAIPLAIGLGSVMLETERTAPGYPGELRVLNYGFSVQNHG